MTANLQKMTFPTASKLPLSGATQERPLEPLVGHPS
jgi:hypothetical protein